MSEAKDLNEQLDASLVVYLTCVAEYRSAMIAVQTAAKAGFSKLNEAKFREPRLERELGATSYRRRKMTPTLGAEPADWSVVHNPQLACVDTTEEGAEVTANRGNVKTDSTLRNRKEETKKASTATATTAAATSKASARPREDLSATPLRWFGARLPQEVRHGQTLFQGCFEQVLELQRAKTKLTEAHEAHTTLMTQQGVQATT
jgi:hypothetical protein